MTLDPATLLKCHEAIPALAKVHTHLQKHLTGLYRATEDEAAAALWHWPELVEAAVKYRELTKPKSGFQSTKVSAMPDQSLGIDR